MQACDHKRLLPRVAHGSRRDGCSSCRRWRSPGRDHALRISVLGKEPDLVVVQRQRVRVEVLGLRSRRTQSPRGVPEVRESLTLHLPLVPPEAPVAKVEGLVRENQGAERLLPGRNVGAPDAQRTLTYDRAEHRVDVANVGVCPAKRRCPVLDPTPRATGSAPLPLPGNRRARRRSACSEPRTRWRSVRARARGRARPESARPRA